VEIRILPILVLSVSLKGGQAESEAFIRHVDSLYQIVVADPDSFDAFVQRFSEDKDSRSKNGDIGSFDLDPRRMDPDLYAQMAKTKKGEILPPSFEDRKLYSTR
jgi:hypothetical protein